MQIINRLLNKKKIKRVPIVLQYEVIECGAASLSMILRSWNLYLPLGEVRKGCGVNRDGSNLKDISEYAKSLGVKCQGKMLGVKKLCKSFDSYPCIVFWDKCHFVVLEGISDDKFFIADPAYGHYELSTDDFAKHYSNVVLCLSKTESFEEAGQKENELKTMLNYLSIFKYSILVLTALAIAGIIPTVITAGLSGSFLNEFIINQRYSFGIPIAWLTLFMAVITGLILLTQKYIFRLISLRLYRRLSISISKKVFTNEFSFYLTRSKGDIMERLFLANQITQLLMGDIVEFSISVVGALLLVPFLILISWQLSLASLAFIICIVCVSIYISSTMKEVSFSVEIDNAKEQGQSVRILSDVETIQASSLDSFYLSNWLDLFAPVSQKQQNINAKLNTLALVNTLISSIYQYGTIVLSGYLVIMGEMNLAGFMAFQALRGYVIDPLSNTASIAPKLREAEAFLGRLSDLFSVDSDRRIKSLDAISSTIRPKSTHSEPTLPKSNASESLLSLDQGNIFVRDLSLTFSPLKPPVLDSISFKVKAGKMLTIVGPSGSGKSTLIKVLAGLYEPSSGSIHYNDHLWIDYNDYGIRNNISYVSQERSTFRGSIGENIAKMNPQYGLDQIRSASELAVLDDVIMALPNGYETILEDGGRGLSGGQLQRLQIASALINNPKIIFLDEATSSLDIPTEIEILENIKSMGATIICVAHRLVSAEMSDQIVVLDQGKIQEQGSPGELKSVESFYKELLEEGV